MSFSLDNSYGDRGGGGRRGRERSSAILKSQSTIGRSNYQHIHLLLVPAICIHISTLLTAQQQCNNLHTQTKKHKIIQTIIIRLKISGYQGSKKIRETQSKYKPEDTEISPHRNKGKKERNKRNLYEGD